MFWRSVVLVLAVALGATACAGEVEAEAEASDAVGDSGGRVFVLSIEGGELVGGVRREEASIGEKITINAFGDGAEQIHIHGYDLYLGLENGEGSIVFDALIPGRFEIEFEESGRLIIELTVK
ncbi:MAG: hypothetical protein ACKVIY_06125 [Acidimicrobiales bacterium]|jgi:hypothetical protein|nr:hypothetical protein [Actinomycetota bacterium]